MFPGHRAEEALRPLTGRVEGEVSRISVAPRGNSGEVGTEALGCMEPPVRRVISPEPVGEPRGGEDMSLRVWEWGLWRRGLRVSSRSLMVRMWWGLDLVAPGEGRGRNSPPAGLLILGLAPWSGLGSGAEKLGVVGRECATSTSWASDSDWAQGLCAIVLFSPLSGISSAGFSGTGGRTSRIVHVYLHRRSGFTVLQYQREHR